MEYILIVIAYLLGAIAFSLVLGKILKKTDIRQYGSGNVGSTNAARILGYKIGLITLILDIAKGLIPTLIAIRLFDIRYASIIGLFSILGHVYPVYLKFKGGKAVATSLGVFIVLAPISVLIALSVFIITLIITRYVAVSSMLAAISMPLSVYFFNYNLNVLYLSLIVSILILYRHKSNINNLINGNESKMF